MGARRLSLALPPLAVAAVLSATPASACVTITDAMRWRGADVIAEGILSCPGLRAPCTLRARRVVKSPRAGAGRQRSFPVQIEFGSRSRYVPVPLDCNGPPWEPTAEQTRGRFYLRRGADGRYTINGWAMQFHGSE